MTMLEMVARALCWNNGMNPDLTLGGDGQNFLWHEYESQAQAAFDVIQLRLRDVLLEHEPLAGPYIHDLIRAVDAELSGASHD